MLQNKKRIISLILMLTLLVSSLVVGAISASAETTKYRLQAKVDGTTYYWDGSVSSGKGGMTTDVSNAVELTVEVVNSETNEVYITFDNNGTTMYLYFTNGNTGFKTQSSKATIHYDATTGYVYEADFTDARYASTYGTDSIRSYKTSNIDGESNVYMVMTAITSSEGGDVVDPEDPVISPVETGDYYIATKRSTGNNYWYMTNDLGEASTKRYQAVDSGLTALPQSIANAENDKIFVVEDNDDGTYSIYAKGTTGDNYLGWTSGNSGTLVAADSALKFTIDAKEDGYYNIHFTGDAERYLSLNNSTGSNYFAFYKGTQAQNLYLIPVVESSGCGDNHTWNEGVATTPATCVSEGVMTYTCTACGEKKTEVISVNAEAHTWDNGSVTTEATCSSEGSKLYTCTLNASHTKTETIAINSEAHNWDDGVVTTPATCVSEGVMTYTCSLNGEHTRTEVIAADHNYVGGYCTKCCNGQPKWVLVDDVSTLGANDKIVIVAGDDSNYALSTNQKSSNREAVVFTISEGVVSFGSDVEIITLEDAGDGMFYFKVSNGYLYASSASSNQLKTRENNDSNAAYGQWIVSMADDVVSIVANRTGRNTLQYNPNNGSPIFSCYGGSTLTAVGIYKLETPEAKHTYDGCLDAECNVCKTVREASHDFTAEIVSENTLATAATCTSAAKYYYSCSVCGAVDSAEDADTFENGDALGHAWNGGVVTTDPSCTAEGVKTYTCGTCGETYTESVHMTEHNWSEATCTTPSTCSGCGATDGDPLDHVWNDGVVTTEPSCTAEGVITYTCGTCGTTDTDSIEATGHNIVDKRTPVNNCDACIFQIFDRGTPFVWVRMDTMLNKEYKFNIGIHFLENPHQGLALFEDIGQGC